MAPNLPGRSRVSAISRQALSLFTLSWKSFEDTSKMHGRCCHISTKVVSIVLLHFLSFSLLAFFLIEFIFAGCYSSVVQWRQLVNTARELQLFAGFPHATGGVVPSCQQCIRHAIPQKILTCQTFRRGVFERRRRKHRRSQACHITRPRLVAYSSKSCTIRKFVCDERIGAKSGWNRVVWPGHYTGSETSTASSSRAPLATPFTEAGRNKMIEARINECHRAVTKFVVKIQKPQTETV